MDVQVLFPRRKNTLLRSKDIFHAYMLELNSTVEYFCGTNKTKYAEWDKLDPRDG